MRASIFLAGAGFWCVLAVHAQTPAVSNIGREVSIPRHLQDGEEFTVPTSELIAYGKKLFCANWTEQEGGGRPMTKGTGKPLSDPKSPLVGMRAFNRLSAPDANSCQGCHNMPYGIAGGGGDFVTNVFVLAQRFDFITFDQNDKLATRGAFDESSQAATLETGANLRATTSMLGAGYLEMLARQITVDLQRIRDNLRRGESCDLSSGGIHFGVLSRRLDGTWDVSKVAGLPRLSLISTGSQDPPTLVIRPWHQSANVVSLREFSNNAFNQHHGLQSTERFGVDTDLDGDGFKNELTRADITAVTLFQATLQVPGRVIPNDPAVERAVLRGEILFKQIGCASCHIPALPLYRANWSFSEPSPFNPSGNLKIGQTKTIRVDLTSSELPRPRLVAGPDQTRIMVPAYTDFKLHDISGDEKPEHLDQNQTAWSPKFRDGNRRFLTKRLWGAANEPPYFHHGLFTTMRRCVMEHYGEALESRSQFVHLPGSDQDSLIEFLKTLQVLPPGTMDLIVDENYNRKIWPPAAEHALSRCTRCSLGK